MGCSLPILVRSGGSCGANGGRRRFGGLADYRTALYRLERHARRCYRETDRVHGEPSPWSPSVGWRETGRATGIDDSAASEIRRHRRRQMAAVLDSERPSSSGWRSPSALWRSARAMIRAIVAAEHPGLERSGGPERPSPGGCRMEPSDLLRHVAERAASRWRVRYLVTGSTATIAYGEPRFTNDIDVVAALPEAKVDAFCAALRGSGVSTAPPRPSGTPCGGTSSSTLIHPGLRAQSWT